MEPQSIEEGLLNFLINNLRIKVNTEYGFKAIQVWIGGTLISEAYL